MNAPKYFVTTELSPSKRDLVGPITESLTEAEDLFKKTPAPKGGMLRLTRRDHEDGKNYNVTLVTKYPS